MSHHHQRLKAVTGWAAMLATASLGSWAVAESTASFGKPPDTAEEKKKAEDRKRQRELWNGSGEIRRAEITDTQEPQGPYRAPPVKDPPPRRPRIRYRYVTGDYYRTGFYLRLAGGVGYGFDALEIESADYGTLGGVGLATEVGVGLYLVPGLALAVGIDTTFMPSISATVPKKNEKFELGTSQAALFSLYVDWFPWASGGYHAQAGVGFGSFVAGDGTSKSLDTVNHVSAGAGFMIGTGYEWWVSGDWSLGLLARLQYLVAQTTSGAIFKHSAGGFAILLSASYD